MAIRLEKGERVDMGLSKLQVEMGWKVDPTADSPHDLDASTFLIRSNGQIGVEADFVFYGSENTITVNTPNGEVTRPISSDGSVIGSADDLGTDEDHTGIGEETIDVDLSKVSPLIDQIIFTASIHWQRGEKNERYNFGQVRDAYILIKDAITGEEICRYDLDEDFSTSKGVEFGRLYRRNGAWRFEASGISHRDGLYPICEKFAEKFIGWPKGRY